MRGCHVIFAIVLGSTCRAELAVPLPWSFKPLSQQVLPEIAQADWPKGRIDHFTLARIEGEGLQPAEPADDRTLLRRLYFDLIGLPPSWEQFEARSCEGGYFLYFSSISIFCSYSSQI